MLKGWQGLSGSQTVYSSGTLVGTLFGSLTCHGVKRGASLTEEEEWRLGALPQFPPTFPPLFEMTGPISAFDRGFTLRCPGTLMESCSLSQDECHVAPSAEADGTTQDQPCCLGPLCESMSSARGEHAVSRYWLHDPGELVLFFLPSLSLSFHL